MIASGVRHLKKDDKKLARLMAKVGSVTFEPKTKVSPFEALVESIVYQQLHGKAAATIFKRVKALFPKKKFPKPEDFLKTPLKRLRSAGLSHAKAQAILDLSQKSLDGLIPSRRKMATLTDEEIINRLSGVRGIGRWTVEMLLIFKLGRPDILPTTDYAIRKALSLMHRRDDLMSPREIARYGMRWKPHRTTAALYLWRSLDKS